MTQKSLEDTHDLRLQASQSEGHHCAEEILRARDPEIRPRTWSMCLAHKPFSIQQTEKPPGIAVVERPYPSRARAARSGAKISRHWEKALRCAACGLEPLPESPRLPENPNWNLSIQRLAFSNQPEQKAENRAQMRYRRGMYDSPEKFSARACAIWVVLIH
jgi:hypothetical protein